MTKPRVECVDCAALPGLLTDLALGEDQLYGPFRPTRPRPIDPRSGPRKPRCATHYEARDKAQRARTAENRRSKVHGMSAKALDALRAAQGDKCPCGSRWKHIDHDHALAREHEHAEDESCPDCWRGLLCHTCNSDILGRGYGERRLLALVEYLRNPPARRIDLGEY
jgi:hypothetical protein